MQTDVIVLGAGMVGVSAAVHLKQKGKSVVLVDRRGAGEETSYGNTGIIERDAFVPVGFPRSIRDLVRYGLNLGTEANYHPSFLLKAAPWLLSLRAHTDKAGIEAYARDIDPLGSRSVGEHRLMTAAAGAEHFVRRDGWLRLYRTEAFWNNGQQLMKLADHYGAPYKVLTPDELSELEPHLKGSAFFKAVHWLETDTVSWPEGLVKAYADLFLSLGGQFFAGDAMSLTQTETGWQVMAGGGSVAAPDVVVALGPWSLDILKPLGYSFPLASKRGYHMHFGAVGNATLNRPVCDLEYGYCLTPMQKGIRLTTGVEIADSDAPPTPRQLEQLSRSRGTFFRSPKSATRHLGSVAARPCRIRCRSLARPSVTRGSGWISVMAISVSRKALYRAVSSPNRLSANRRQSTSRPTGQSALTDQWIDNLSV